MIIKEQPKKKRPRGCRGKKAKNNPPKKRYDLKSDGSAIYHPKGTNLNVEHLKMDQRKSLMNTISVKCTYCKNIGIAIWWLEKYFILRLNSDIWWIICQFLGINKNQWHPTVFDKSKQSSISQHMPYFGFICESNDGNYRPMKYRGKMTRVDKDGNIKKYRRRYIFTCKYICTKRYMYQVQYQSYILNLYNNFKMFCRLRSIYMRLQINKNLGSPSEIYVIKNYMASRETIAVHTPWRKSNKRFLTRNERAVKGLFDSYSVNMKDLWHKIPSVKSISISDLKSISISDLKQFIYYNMNNMVVDSILPYVKEAPLHIRVINSGVKQNVKTFDYCNAIYSIYRCRSDDEDIDENRYRGDGY